MRLCGPWGRNAPYFPKIATFNALLLTGRNCSATPLFPIQLLATHFGRYPFTSTVFSSTAYRWRSKLEIEMLSVHHHSDRDILGITYAEIGELKAGTSGTRKSRKEHRKLTYTDTQNTYAQPHLYCQCRHTQHTYAAHVY